MNTTIKKILPAVLLMCSILMVGQTQFKTDKASSLVNWKGSKPTGEHYGTVNLKSGHFTYQDKKIVEGEFEIDMNSIINLDMPSDSESNAKLVKHLKSDDFFAASKYPVAIFKLSSTEPKGDKTLCKGNLTIKGITHPVSFLATITQDGQNLSLKSETFKIDRSKWNIKFKSKSFFSDLGDKFIYDDIELSVDVHAVN